MRPSWKVTLSNLLKVALVYALVALERSRDGVAIEPSKAEKPSGRYVLQNSGQHTCSYHISLLYFPLL
jgi:hypothetical protein